MARRSRLIYVAAGTTKLQVEPGPVLVTGIVITNDGTGNVTLILFDQEDAAAPGNAIGRLVVGGDEALYIPFPEPLAFNFGIAVDASASLDVTFVVRT